MMDWYDNMVMTERDNYRADMVDDEGAGWWGEDANGDPVWVTYDTPHWWEY